MKNKLCLDESRKFTLKLLMKNKSDMKLEDFYTILTDNKIELPKKDIIKVLDKIKDTRLSFAHDKKVALDAELERSFERNISSDEKMKIAFQFVLKLRNIFQ